ncbi:MAG: HD domain-containing protein [Prolixibacteraceae bacterium]|nr:HD domain-containing protein [Prolixibacteraceae bacterium]
MLWQPIHHAVNQYISTFHSNDVNIQLNFDLKREHISRVIQNAEMIALSIDCDETVRESARLAALLHDAGRFIQFQQYQTYNDEQSEDHAIIALRLIDQNNWLAEIPEELRHPIIKAVEYHNKLAVPKNETAEVMLLSNILRDADKLDILDQAVKEYSLQNKNRNSAFSLDLEPSPMVSKAIAKSLASKKLPSKSDMKTITDFKLVQMAFVYDLHFKLSYSLINKKGILKQLFDTMPKSDQVFELYRKARIHVENQLI